MKTFLWNDVIERGRLCIKENGSSITVGSFDGPHVGHEKIFRLVLGSKKKLNTTSILITFERPLPALKHKDCYMGDISTLNERLREYEKRGFDYTVVVTFDDNFKNTSGLTFLSLLEEKLKMKFIAEGSDFHFGKSGACGKGELLSFGDAHNIEVQLCDLLKTEDKNVSTRVSSSNIRNCIKNGNFSLAEKLLGRPYELDFSALKCEVTREKDAAGEEFTRFDYNRKDCTQVLPKNDIYDISSEKNTSFLRTRLRVGEKHLSLITPTINGLTRIESVCF